MLMSLIRTIHNWLKCNQISGILDNIWIRIQNGYKIMWKFRIDQIILKGTGVLVWRHAGTRPTWNGFNGVWVESGISNFRLHLVTKWLQNRVKISNRSNHFEGYRGAGVTSHQHPELKFEILNFLVSYKKSFCGYIWLQKGYKIMWNFEVKNHNLGCWCDGPFCEQYKTNNVQLFFSGGQGLTKCL